MPHDLTEIITAARTNDPRVVNALSERFSGARFHLPLTTLEGVKKNRPESRARSWARTFPSQRLRLATGLIAIPLFTNLELCRECAKKLSWKTDGKAIKTLPGPGVHCPRVPQGAPAVPRGRSRDRESSERGRSPPRAHRGGGDRPRNEAAHSLALRAKRRPESSGRDRRGSLLSRILSAAGRAVSKAEETEIEPAPSFESLPEGGPWGSPPSSTSFCTLTRVMASRSS